MSLPPALLQRLAQRGLVQKQSLGKSKETNNDAAAKVTSSLVENEEVIAEDYDEMEEPDHPSQYESSEFVKRPEENFWLERMKLRIGEAGSYNGHKGCPNKYNVYHKCSLYCVNRWAEGHAEPSRDYIKRYKRLLRRYPLPKGWIELYDPGCGCFYFCNVADNMVSWLPPTHPKSEITKCAAIYRRQLEEANSGVLTGGGADGADGSTDDEQNATTDGREDGIDTKHQKEIDEIMKMSLNPPRMTVSMAAAASSSSSHDAVSAHDVVGVAPSPTRKPKSRDLEKTLLRQRREREYEKERNDKDVVAVVAKESERGGHNRNHHHRRHARSKGNDLDILDPMDPSAYSDTPRGKWSDGLNVDGDERKKSGGNNTKNSEQNNVGGGGGGSGGGKNKVRSGNRSDDNEGDDENEDDYY